MLTNTSEYGFTRWLESIMPPGKKEFTFSRDALEILLRIAYKQGADIESLTPQWNKEEDERERQHGPRFI